MLENIQLDKIFFLDIETVPQFEKYENVPETFKELWNLKADRIIKDESASAEDVYERAGIYAEFGKIVCISVGLFTKKDNSLQFRLKSFYGDDEKQILADFGQMLDVHFNVNKNYLCAHNGKEFDFPYISRRMIIHGLPLPEPIDNWGKKPWETVHLIDTMHLWRFGDYKSYTSLNLLCASLDIPTPKDDISGKDVWKVYWQEKDLERIVKYCEKDVLAIARLMQRYKRVELIDDNNVEHIS